MRVVKDAKVTLEWSDGHRTEIGTIHAETDTKELRTKVKGKISRQRIGWEFVRLGMKVIFPGKKWVTEYDPEEDE